jgi:Skp family chaperone for outer membrane proteins
MKKLKRNEFIFLSIWLLVLTLSFSFQMMRQKTYGVIDTQSIVAIEAQKIATLYPQNNIPPEKLQVIVERLRQRVESFANAQNLVLFAKGAVWGGSFPDYTTDVIESLKAE